MTGLLALRRTGCRIILTVALLLGATMMAAAQPVPQGPVGRPEIGPPERPALPEFAPREPKFVLPPVVPPADRPPPLSQTLRIYVTGFRFEGNTAVTDAELAEVAAPFAGRELSSEDLQELRYRLTQYYIDRGYITSGAVLPDQDVADGIVTYRIVEGELTDIAVAGTGGLDPDYVRDRLALAAERPLHIGTLRERIQLLVQDPLFERLNAELAPGIRPGESRLDVDVTRAQPYALWLGLDNAAPPSTGELRGTALGVVRNLTGKGDVLELGYERTEGAQEFSLAFELPLNRYGTRLRASAEIAGSQVVEEPLDELDIESDARTLEVGLIHPLVLDVRDRVELGVALARRHTETSLLGRPFSFSEGVRDGKTAVSALRLLQTWLRREPDQVIAARSTFSYGLDLGGITQNPGDLPDGRFLSWLGQFQWARRFDERGTQLLFRTDLQLARDPLLPLEQIAIGGLDSVRGYRENTLVRDQGLIASVEGRIPVFRIPVPRLSTQVDDGWLSVVPFADFGTGWNRDRDTPDPRSIASLGLGLRWEISPDINAQLFYAHPLHDVRDDDGDALQDRGIHFRLSFRAF